MAAERRHHPCHCPFRHGMAAAFSSIHGPHRYIRLQAELLHNNGAKWRLASFLHHRGRYSTINSIEQRHNNQRTDPGDIELQQVVASPSAGNGSITRGRKAPTKEAAAIRITPPIAHE